MSDELHRDRAREFEQPGLGRRIGDIARLALMAGGRDDVDDGATRCSLDHLFGDMLREQERAPENDLRLTIPFRERHVQNALPVEDRGVVDQPDGAWSGFWLTRLQTVGPEDQARHAGAGIQTSPRVRAAFRLAGRRTAGPMASAAVVCLAVVARPGVPTEGRAAIRC